MSSSSGGNDNSTGKPGASGGVKRSSRDGNGVEIMKLLRSLQSEKVRLVKGG